jgi:multicomponent Na+:H+ antiporter subunit A
VTAGLAALSMAGLPPLFGFISKELTYEAALEFGPWLTAAIVAAGLFFVFVAGIVGIGPFWGRKTETPKSPHEAPPSMWLGSLTLAGLSLLIGLFPGFGEQIARKPCIFRWPVRRPALSWRCGTE